MLLLLAAAVMLSFVGWQSTPVGESVGDPCLGGGICLGGGLRLHGLLWPPLLVGIRSSDPIIVGQMGLRIVSKRSPGRLISPMRCLMSNLGDEDCPEQHCLVGG